MSAAKIFIDTNILIYAYDSSAGEKHKVASQKLEELWRAESGLLSMQVLQEFYVNVTRKLARPLTRSVARSLIEDLSRMEVVVLNSDAILTAIDVQRDYMLSFWDTMIVTAAFTGGAETLLTEDLNHGQIVKNVSIVNPFL